MGFCGVPARAFLRRDQNFSPSLIQFRTAVNSRLTWGLNIKLEIHQSVLRHTSNLLLAGNPLLTREIACHGTFVSYAGPELDSHRNRTGGTLRDTRAKARIQSSAARSRLDLHRGFVEPAPAPCLADNPHIQERIDDEALELQAGAVEEGSRVSRSG